MVMVTTEAQDVCALARAERTPAWAAVRVTRTQDLPLARLSGGDGVEVRGGLVEGGESVEEDPATCPTPRIWVESKRRCGWYEFPWAGDVVFARFPEGQADGFGASAEGLFLCFWAGHGVFLCSCDGSLAVVVRVPVGPPDPYKLSATAPSRCSGTPGGGLPHPPVLEGRGSGLF